MLDIVKQKQTVSLKNSTELDRKQIDLQHLQQENYSLRLEIEEITSKLNKCSFELINKEAKYKS
jgi:hypothetical protein